MKRILGIIFCFFCCILLLQAQRLTQNGFTDAGIILPDQADPVEVYAAEELQYWIQRISSARLPIIRSVPDERSQTPNIFIGKEFAREYFSGDLEKIGSTDGFAVRKKAGHIYIFGGISKGTLHGVYAFLEANSDIIWCRPDPEEGTVYSVTDQLQVSNADFISIPASSLRGMGWTVHSTRYEHFWGARNRMNWHGYYHSSLLRLGPEYFAAGGGHGLKLYMSPDQYFETHPEYFPMIQGKRVPYGQLCFMADEMIPEYVKNLRQTFDTKPESAGVNISITDGWRVCECERCLRPLELENGQVIPVMDDVFRSAQYYRFINKIAREIKKTHPDKVLLVYAYIFAVYPPPFELEDNIRVMFCPFVKDDKFPIYDENRNRQWREYLLGWSKATDKTWLREYYGCAGNFPRPLEDTVQQDLQFCLKNGIREFNTEWPVDHSSGKTVWDISAMNAWIIARLWWDPSQDVETLRDHYISRTFREAAEPMKKYYELIRKSWYGSSYPSVYSDTDLMMVKHYIVNAGIEESCRDLLKEAAEKAVHPISRLLVEKQLKIFEKWISAVQNDKTVRAEVPYEKDSNASDFDAPVWKNAVLLDPFVVCDPGKKGNKALFRTDVRLTHDRKNLYIRFDMLADDMERLPVTKASADGREQFPAAGDIMEFYLADPATGVYYQFAFDAGNQAVYEAKGYDAVWKCHWQRNIRLDDDRWVAIVTVPLDEIGCNITTGNKLLFLPIRGKTGNGLINPATGKEIAGREMSSWGGGYVHEVAAFGELTLKQN